jgi:hypothetical protein
MSGLNAAAAPAAPTSTSTPAQGSATAAPKSAAPSTSPATGNNLGVPQPANATGASTTKPDGAVDTKPATPDAAEQLRRWKLKTDGVEEELDEAEVIRRAQRAGSADKRYEDAARMRQQAEGLVRAIQDDPVDLALRVHGPEKIREMFEKYLVAQIQREQMSPAEREALELKEKLKTYQQQEEERQTKVEQERVDGLKQEFQGKFRTKITEAISTHGLPDDQESVSRAAFYMQQLLRAGHQADNLPMAEVADRVRQDYARIAKAALAKLDGKSLLGFLGDDIADKFRQADLERVKSGLPNVPGKPVETPISKGEGQPRQPQKYISMDELQRRVKAKLNS